jgi:hypothetical protein
MQFTQTARSSGFFGLREREIVQDMRPLKRDLGGQITRSNTGHAASILARPVQTKQRRGILGSVPSAAPPSDYTPLGRRCRFNVAIKRSRQLRRPRLLEEGRDDQAFDKGLRLGSSLLVGRDRCDIERFILALSDRMVSKADA